MLKTKQLLFFKKLSTQLKIGIFSVLCILMFPSAMAQSKTNEVIAYDLYKGLTGSLKCKMIQMEEGSTGIKSNMNTPIILKLNGNEGVMEYANNSYPIIYRATNGDHMQYQVIDSKNDFFNAVYIVISEKNRKPIQLKLFARRYDFLSVC